MGYTTMPVELVHGSVVTKGGESLPEQASGLLIILEEPPPLSVPRPIGLAKGQFTVPSDFNSPLPEETLRDFEGR